MENPIAKAKDDKAEAIEHHKKMMTYLEKIQKEYEEPDINMVKPGIAEATRVMLRRVPRVLIVRNTNDKDTLHVIQLAKDKDVPVVVDEDMPVKAVSLISNNVNE
jgi:ribosomal protein L7Ae-like RNA K-turn-binding protein